MPEKVLAEYDSLGNVIVFAQYHRGELFLYNHDIELTQPKTYSYNKESYAETCYNFRGFSINRNSSNDYNFTFSRSVVENRPYYSSSNLVHYYYRNHPDEDQADYKDLDNDKINEIINKVLDSYAFRLVESNADYKNHRYNKFVSVSCEDKIPYAWTHYVLNNKIVI